MLTPDFSKPEDLERYEGLMSKLVDLVCDKYDGSLKAEHGTGVNMAPYVEREWGGKATELMWRIKGLADPDGVLAPGVVLNRDAGAHLKNLKTTPPIEEVATNCVECGFCEPVCPSRHLTLTPRQRIVIRREMARQPKGSPVQAALLEQYALRRHGDLRRRRHLRPDLPALDRHRGDGQGAPRRDTRREGRAPRRAARKPLGPGRARGPRHRWPPAARFAEARSAPARRCSAPPSATS